MDKYYIDKDAYDWIKTIAMSCPESNYGIGYRDAMIDLLEEIQEEPNVNI